MESLKIKIRCCFFDMGNVLVHFSHQKMCEQIGQLCQYSGDQINQLIIESGLLNKIELGLISEVEFHSHFQDLVSRQISFEELKRASSDIFDLNSEIVPILEELKRLEIRLVLLSNTSSAHVDFIREKFEILDLFDDYTLSYEVGSMKPDQEIYLDAIKKAECLPEECFYTDDIEQNILAAKKLGIKAVQFLSAAQLADDMKKRGIPLNL